MDRLTDIETDFTIVYCLPTSLCHADTELGDIKRLLKTHCWYGDTM